MAEYVNIYRSFPAGYQAMTALEEACAAGPLDPGAVRAGQAARRRRSTAARSASTCTTRTPGPPARPRSACTCSRRGGSRRVYTDAERAALALTEEVTLIADGHVPADVEAAAREPLRRRRRTPRWCSRSPRSTPGTALAITSHAVAGRYQPKVRDRRWRAPAGRSSASRTVSDSGPGRVKPHTVSVPCQWATTSSPSPVAPPGASTRRSLDGGGERRDPHSPRARRTRVAEVLAQHHELVGEVVSLVLAGQRNEMSTTRRRRATARRSPPRCRRRGGPTRSVARSRPSLIRSAGRSSTPRARAVGQRRERQ